MIKLQTNFRHINNPSFYFKNADNCDSFVQYLKREDCNPPWRLRELVFQGDGTENLKPEEIARIWCWWLTFNTELDEILEKENGYGNDEDS